MVALFRIEEIIITAKLKLSMEFNTINLKLYMYDLHFFLHILTSF